jgi:hypothetical protein
MHMRFSFLRSLACGVALALACVGAAAQETASQNNGPQDSGPAAVAMASAVSYGPIPPGTPLDVLPASDTELANDAVAQTIQGLGAQGHAASPDASYVLTVDAVLIRAIGQDAGLDRPQEGTQRGDQYTNADKSQSGEPLTRGNLFSSEDGALLSPAQPQTGGHLLRVSFAVYSRQSGLYVWRGQIERDSIGVGPDASLQQMIPALLEHFGSTLAETEVPLN